MDALDRLPQERRHRKRADLPTTAHRVVERDRVRHEERLQAGLLDPLARRSGKDGVDRRGERPARALLAECFLGLDEGAGRVDDVVQDQDVLSLDVSDDV